MKVELIFTDMDEPSMEGARLTVDQVEQWNLRTPSGAGTGRGELHLSTSGSQAIWALPAEGKAA